MADDEVTPLTTSTTNYGWVKPDIGASDDVWGGQINTDLDSIDSIVHGIDIRPSGGATISATAPSSPAVGALWWDSVGGQLYTFYNDGNTSQWVIAVNAGATLLPASTTVLGAVKVDGATIQAAVDGTISTTVVPMGDNRIINGDMRIDQRNNGASASTGNVYTVDRWQFGGLSSKINWGRNYGSFTPPSSFPYYLGFLTGLAYTPAAGETFYIYQNIEADMVSDFAWGTASAQPVTLSFWVQSNQTGTFSGSLSASPALRSYPFTYSIPVANTWTRIVITVPGDTTGAWVMSGNASGVRLFFDLGTGSSVRGTPNTWQAASLVGATGAVSIVTTLNATFCLTGVKLEIGSVATPYNRQSLAKSMADCQRYFQVLGGGGGAATVGIQGNALAAASMSCTVGFQTMRTAPTATINGSFSSTNTGTVTLFTGPNTVLIQLNPPASGPASWYNSGGNILLVAEL